MAGMERSKNNFVSNNFVDKAPFQQYIAALNSPGSTVCFLAKESPELTTSHAGHNWTAGRVHRRRQPISLIHIRGLFATCFPADCEANTSKKEATYVSELVVYPYCSPKSLVSLCCCNCLLLNNTCGQKPIRSSVENRRRLSIYSTRKALGGRDHYNSSHGV